jgi:hypothetical protein
MQPLHQVQAIYLAIEPIHKHIVSASDLSRDKLYSCLGYIYVYKYLDYWFRSSEADAKILRKQQYCSR